MLSDMVTTITLLDIRNCLLLCVAILMFQRYHRWMQTPSKRKLPCREEADLSAALVDVLVSGWRHGLSNSRTVASDLKEPQH